MSPTAATKAATNKPATRATKAEAPAPAEVETDNQKRNRLRNEAERHILNLHKDEFADYATALFKDNGLVFNRRLSEAEKAQKTIESLIAKHPELADSLRAQLTVTAADPKAEDRPDYGDAIEESVDDVVEPVFYPAPEEDVAEEPSEEEYTSFAPTPGYGVEESVDPFSPNYQG